MEPGRGYPGTSGGSLTSRARATPPIRLVPTTSAHAAGMEELIRDPDVLRFTRVPDPPPPTSSTPGFGATRTAVATGPERRSRSRIHPTRRFLGIAVAPSIKREERTAELGYVIHPDARGRGVATAALSWLTDWGFRELDAIRLELVISTQNPASKRVAEHNGYRYEGTLRSLFVVPGRWDDAEMWSRLATDP